MRHNLFSGFQSERMDKSKPTVQMPWYLAQWQEAKLSHETAPLQHEESGMDIVCLDPELEYKDLAVNMDGCYIDLMEGEYIINDTGTKTLGGRQRFRTAPRHISFLRDFSCL